MKRAYQIIVNCEHDARGHVLSQEQQTTAHDNAVQYLAGYFGGVVHVVGTGGQGYVDGVPCWDTAMVYTIPSIPSKRKARLAAETIRNLYDQDHVLLIPLGRAESI